MTQAAPVDLQALVDRIIHRTSTELGYPVAGYKLMLQTFIRTRPTDFKRFLRIVREETEGKL